MLARAPPLERCAVNSVAKNSVGKEPDWWPRDPLGYIFLARVVEKIGAALHDDWTGKEATTNEMDPLPSNLKTATDLERQTADVLLSQSPIFGLLISWPATALANFRMQTGKLHVSVHESYTTKGSRLRDTQEEIARRSEAGDIVLKIRSTNGLWRDFGTNWWNIERWRTHFVRGRIDPEYPNGDRPSWNREDNHHLIFATSESIERTLKSLPASRGGRKPFPHWQVLETEALNLMKTRGDFTLGNPKWNAQARLEEALLDYCEKKLKLKEVEMPGATQL
jgi:hypothetical protein